jgi:hypothetical protein
MLSLKRYLGAVLQWVMAERVRVLPLVVLAVLMALFLRHYPPMVAVREQLQLPLAHLTLVELVSLIPILQGLL